MKRKVLVEETLTNVKDYLSQQGYQVDALKSNGNNLPNCDAVVISGQSEDFMGMQDTLTKAPVIDARGMTAEQVYDQIKGSLS